MKAHNIRRGQPLQDHVAKSQHIPNLNASFGQKKGCSAAANSWIELLGPFNLDSIIVSGA